jgi:hypothetical protein
MIKSVAAEANGRLFLGRHARLEIMLVNKSDKRVAQKLCLCIGIMLASLSGIAVRDAGQCFGKFLLIHPSLGVPRLMRTATLWESRLRLFHHEASNIGS